ncbi:hypothetical protein OU789_10840 [Halocynthiibacter sp. C4]|uniref:hypothetical protein n=1 Tax=Halocynthiibacter sp. C4 TaxID=2992758 RepID=UPI00237BDC1B|nr:hypothetical protein [Halocynthiibacter sp. C4]MDE0590423.1 hypothetical protein [Halocynthiibacter sp. C4]
MSKSKSPCWGYRAGKDGVESKLFPDGNRPKEWKDSPAKVKLVKVKHDNGK